MFSEQSILSPKDHHETSILSMDVALPPCDVRTFALPAVEKTKCQLTEAVWLEVDAKDHTAKAVTLRVKTRNGSKRKPKNLQKSQGATNALPTSHETASAQRLAAPKPSTGLSLVCDWSPTLKMSAERPPSAGMHGRIVDGVVYLWYGVCLQMSCGKRDPHRTPKTLDTTRRQQFKRPAASGDQESRERPAGVMTQHIVCVPCHAGSKCCFGRGTR